VYRVLKVRCWDADSGAAPRKSANAAEQGSTRRGPSANDSVFPAGSPPKGQLFFFFLPDAPTQTNGAECSYTGDAPFVDHFCNSMFLDEAISNPRAPDRGKPRPMAQEIYLPDFVRQSNAEI
jgi:hypothetical protein